MLRDAAASDLAKRYLKPVRNQIGFHHDLDVVRQGLCSSPTISQDFARGSSEAFVDAYYPFADFVVWRYLLDGNAAAGSEEVELTRATTEIIDLATKYCSAADSILGETLDELGFAVDWD